MFVIRRLRVGWQVSQRIQDTDIPVMTMTRRMLAGVDGALSLAQGKAYPLGTASEACGVALLFVLPVL